jgi:hypothetical protein
MQGLVDINKLIKIVRDIEAEEQAEYEKIRKAKEDLERKILEESLKGLDKKD